MFGSRNARKSDFIELIDMEKEGKADLENVIINLYEADHSALAFKDFDNNAGNMLKVMIDFNNFTDHRFIKNGVSPSVCCQQPVSLSAYSSL